MGLGAVAEAGRGLADPRWTRQQVCRLRVHVWSPGFSRFGGGIAVFSRALARALADMGHDVRLLGKSDTGSTYEELPLVGAGSFPGVIQRQMFALQALTSAARHRPDHIISTHVNFAPAAQIVKQSFGIPYTLVAHGVDIHAGLPARTQAALRAADAIVAVSTWTRLRVLDLGGIDATRVAILPNTFDETRFCPAPARNDLRDRFQLTANERVLLTVARLALNERYKGYDRVIRSLASIRERCGEIRFILVGQGDDRRRIEDLASNLDVRSLVTFAGFVSDQELADYYRLADLFVMPSTGEGFGIVFLEAMACGVPVLAGNRDGSVDALDHGRLGKLVDPNDVGAITAGVQAMLERNGPDLWFNPHALHTEAVERFGRRAFARQVGESLRFLS